MANTSLRLPRSIAAVSYSAPKAFPNVEFIQPIAFASPPGETNRLFVAEKNGRIMVISNLALPNRSVFLELGPRNVHREGECGVLGMTFHPGYSTNGFFYVFYSLSAFTTSAGTGIHQRLSRFQAVPPGANTVRLDTERPLITQYDQMHNHNGGDLHFGPDGYLYVAVGDEGGGGDSFNNSQRIGQDFFSGILRLDVDGRPGNLEPNVHPALSVAGSIKYRIPVDNPWVGATRFNEKALDPLKVRTEFYAVGLRNPWRMSFDLATGLLYCGDVGQSAREEVNLIRKGGNYGWAFREGSIAGPKPGLVPSGTPSEPPLYEYLHGSLGEFLGNSITGGRVVRGGKLPELEGWYVFGDYVSGNIWALSHDGVRTNGLRRILVEPGIVSFGVDPRDGSILMAALSSGKVLRLQRRDPAADLPIPSTLSASGAFSDIKSLSPAPGVVPYEVNASFWSDGADKQRWFCLPKTQDVMRFNATEPWGYPSGSVWVKHFDMVTNEITGERRRLETRFLVLNDGAAYGLSYRWRLDGSDADLVPDSGRSERIQTVTSVGGLRSQDWLFPSRGSCMVCHQSASGYVLSFNTAQLNRNSTYSGEGTTNQLGALRSAGYFLEALPPPSALPVLVSVSQTDASLEFRARSLLHANCAFCHRPGGVSSANWDARITSTTDAARIIDGSLLDTQGDSSNRVLRVGDPDHSMLLRRLRIRGQTQMPPLASTVPDVQGIALLEEWIRSRELKQRASYLDWASLFHKDLTAAEALRGADPDLDGESNVAEFALGTDPLNTHDHCKLRVEWAGGVPIFKVWQPANRRLFIEATAVLGQAAAWKALPFEEPFPRFPAQGRMLTVPIDTTEVTQSYFRVRSESP